MTTGSGSSFNITRLAATYRKQINNGHVLSLRSSVDLIDQRIAQLLDRIDFDEAPMRTINLYKLWQDFKKYDQNSTDYVLLKKQLDDEFDKIYHDYAAWNQIFEALDLRGKTVEREVKVLKEIKAIMTAEDGYKLVAKVMAAVGNIIGDDPKKMKQVQYEFAKIIGESSDNTVQELDGVAGGGREESGGTT